MVQHTSQCDLTCLSLEVLLLICGMNTNEDRRTFYYYSENKFYKILAQDLINNTVDTPPYAWRPKWRGETLEITGSLIR